MLFIGLNGSFTKREVNEHLQFEKFKENGDISSYEIVLLDSKINGADLHEEARNYLLYFDMSPLIMSPNYLNCFCLLFCVSNGLTSSLLSLSHTPFSL